MIVRLIIAGLLISTIGLAGCGKKDEYRLRIKKRGRI